MSTSDKSASRKLAEPFETAIGAVVAAAALAADRDAPAVEAAVEQLRGLLVLRLLPAEPTLAIREVLGMMNFDAVRIAHLFRASGIEILQKTEEEQAYVLFRFLPLALEHGLSWPLEAKKLTDAAYVAAKAQRATGDTP